MSILVENWFFVLILLACIAMHFFHGHGYDHGHGHGHGPDHSHGGPGGSDLDQRPQAEKSR